MRWVYMSFVLFLALTLMIGCAATGSVPTEEKSSTPDWTNMEGVWQEGGFLFAVGVGTCSSGKDDAWIQGYAHEMAKKQARSKLRSYAQTIAGSSREQTEVDFSGFQVVKVHHTRDGGWTYRVLGRLPVDAIRTW